jgi:hypothetical protein
LPRVLIKCFLEERDQPINIGKPAPFSGLGALSGSEPPGLIAVMDSLEAEQERHVAFAWIHARTPEGQLP